MGNQPSTAKATNIVESATKISTYVMETATLQNQQIATVNQQVTILNVEGNVNVVFGGSTTVVLNTESLQEAYFSGQFDTEIINTVEQLAESVAESIPMFQGSTSSESTNVTSLITELVYAVSNDYVTQCMNTIILNQSVIVAGVTTPENADPSTVSITFSSDTYIDSTSNCAQSTSSVIAIRNALTNTIEQAASAETKSSLWSVIIACTLIIIVCALIIFVSYSNLIKLMVFLVCFALVGAGLWAFSAWMLGAPPFEADESSPSNGGGGDGGDSGDEEDEEDEVPVAPPEPKDGFELVSPGQEYSVLYRDGAPIPEGMRRVSFTLALHNARNGNALFIARVEVRDPSSPDGKWLTIARRTLLATPTPDRLFQIFQGTLPNNDGVRLSVVNESDDYLHVDRDHHLNTLTVSEGKIVSVLAGVTTEQAPSFSVRGRNSAKNFRLIYDDGFGFIYEFMSGTAYEFIASQYDPPTVITPPPFDFAAARAYHEEKGMNQADRPNYSQTSGPLSYRISVENTSESGDMYIYL